MTESARALLTGIVDYAGTFPPARLEVFDALRLYARYLREPHAWMLGRFIIPFSDIGQGPVRERWPWPLSVIVSADDLPTLRPVLLESRFIGPGNIDSVEVPPCEPAKIRNMPRTWRGFEIFFETPVDPGAEERLDAIAEGGFAAKVRTGGLEPQAFPSAEKLAGFLLACRERQIAFKATAGLHHPFRSAHRLGAEAGGAEVIMHGFVNLAVAACLLHVGVIGAREVIEVLEERDPGAFVFEEGAMEWRGRRMGVPEIEEARRSFFRSFGACSFEEPVEGLQEARVL